MSPKILARKRSACVSISISQSRQRTYKSQISHSPHTCFSCSFSLSLSSFLNLSRDSSRASLHSPKSTLTTEKGIRKLCRELMNLKDAVENLCGNMCAKYLSFLRVVPWAEWEIEFFALLIKENAPSSETVDALHGACACVLASLNHCSMLEPKGLNHCSKFAQIYLPDSENGEDPFSDPDPLPSLPFQALFAKLQQLAAGDVLIGKGKMQKFVLARFTETVVMWLYDEQDFWGVFFEDASSPIQPFGLQQDLVRGPPLEAAYRKCKC